MQAAASPYFNPRKLRCSCNGGNGRGDGRARCILDDAIRTATDFSATATSSTSRKRRKTDGLGNRSRDGGGNRISKAYSAAPPPWPAQPLPASETTPNQSDGVAAAEAAAGVAGGAAAAVGAASAVDAAGVAAAAVGAAGAGDATAAGDSFPHPQRKIGIIIGQAPGPNSADTAVPPLPFAGKAEKRLARLASNLRTLSRRHYFALTSRGRC